MAPIIAKCKSHPAIDPIICSTGQHREVLVDLIRYFDVEPDIDLEAMSSTQHLLDLVSRCLTGFKIAFETLKPDVIAAQGDTATVLSCSLAAFMTRIPFIHIEAGLRTNRLDQPWPEEYNRRVTSIATSLHCAPTENAKNNLMREGVPDRDIIVSGNTVIDSLLTTLERQKHQSHALVEKFSLSEECPVILVTGHRRENIGQGISGLCQAIRKIAYSYPHSTIVFPLHPNPAVRSGVLSSLSHIQNIRLVEPLMYPEFIWLMAQSSLIITDSGGVQEEAPSIGVPVLVTRQCTERPEGLVTGLVEVVGSDADRIVNRAAYWLAKARPAATGQIFSTVYGDGTASDKIVREMLARHSKVFVNTTNAGFTRNVA